MQQFLPRDYETRVAQFMAMLQDLTRQRGFTQFIVGDETGVRMEDIPISSQGCPFFFFENSADTYNPECTMEARGAKSVKVRTSGKERTMFTVWLWSSIEKHGDKWVCLSVKMFPLHFLFSGRKERKTTHHIQRVT